MIRVFYSAQRASIVVGAAKQVYPSQSLEARADGNVVSVWPPDGLNAILVSEFSEISDVMGNGFSDVASTVSYLNSQFARTPYADTNEFDPGDLAAYFTSL